MGEPTVAILHLAVLAGLVVWLVQGLAEAGGRYVRSRRLARGDALRLMARGAAGIGAYLALSLWLVQPAGCPGCGR